MDAICADETDSNCANGAHNIAGVMEGIGHGQNAGAKWTLEQVDESVHVTEWVDQRRGYG